MVTTGTPWVSKYSRVRPMSRMDLIPAQTTPTGVRLNSVRSALMSIPTEGNVFSIKAGLALTQSKQIFQPLRKCYHWAELKSRNQWNSLSIIHTHANSTTHQQASERATPTDTRQEIAQTKLSVRTSKGSEPVGCRFSYILEKEESLL